MKKYLILLLVLLQVILLSACDAFGKPSETAEETEGTSETAESTDNATTEETTAEVPAETVPATMGHAPELSDADIPSVAWSEGTNQ